MKKIILLNLVILLTVSGCATKLYDGSTLPNSEIAIIKFDKPFHSTAGVYSIHGREKVETIFGGRELRNYTKFKILPGLTVITIRIHNLSHYLHTLDFLAEAGHTYQIYWEGYPKQDYASPVKIWIYDETSGKNVAEYLSTYLDHI